MESFHKTFQFMNFDFFNQQDYELVNEEMYALVLKPGQSAARNDIGSTPHALFSLKFQRTPFSDPVRVALAKLIIITESGEYIYSFSGGQGNSIEINPSLYPLN